MPRSNSSFGVAEGGKRGQRGAGAGTARAWRQCAAGIARAGRAEIERLARPASAGRADRRLHWRSATGRRRARAARRGQFGFWLGSKASPRRRPGGRRRGRLLHDRRGRCDLRLLVSRLRLRIARLGLRLPWLGLGCTGGGSGRLAAATLGWATGGWPAGATAAPPPSCLSRSSSWRLRYCSSSFWPVSCRSWFSSRWIRISRSASSDCADACEDERQHRGDRRGAGSIKKSG